VFSVPYVLLHIQMPSEVAEQDRQFSPISVVIVVLACVNCTLMYSV